METKTYPVSERTQQQLDNAFTYHAPKADQLPRYEALRAGAKLFAEMIVSFCPESREKSLALTHLKLSVRMANAAIARNE